MTRLSTPPSQPQTKPFFPIRGFRHPTNWPRNFALFAQLLLLLSLLPRGTAYLQLQSQYPAIQQPSPAIHRAIEPSSHPSIHPSILPFNYPYIRTIPHVQSSTVHTVLHRPRQETYNLNPHTQHTQIHTRIRTAQTFQAIITASCQYMIIIRIIIIIASLLLTYSLTGTRRRIASHAQQLCFTTHARSLAGPISEDN